MKFLFVMMSILFSVYAADIPLQSREISPQNMKKQNKEIAKLAAQELSKALPSRIDKYTELTSIKADDTTLVYIFEIDISPKSDESVKKNDHSRMKEAVTLGVCRNSKRFLDADISIQYIYNSAHSKSELFRFDINKEVCFNTLQ
ncbi:hypothetical protein FCU45_05995 [Sulfurimonas crateris]|uniref:Uncharacterized protein n=1 Tax=Sulfurimonas crateris TaxID=2574727 RepID=A0A4U2Z5V7_9BACT|nr:hypothetical protein [Sulfurimonas crateris]TKI69607.1 hypothetical protein FCU45_05995 [Sulfurimonas crateris]